MHNALVDRNGRVEGVLLNYTYRLQAVCVKLKRSYCILNSSVLTRILRRHAISSPATVNQRRLP